MKFGDKIKQLRIENKWTQEYVADKLHISMGALSRYETGMYEPKSLDLLKDFAQLFNVSTDYLLGKTDNRNSTPLTEEEMGFVSQVKELEPAQKDFLKSVMKTLKEQKNKDK